MISDSCIFLIPNIFFIGNPSVGLLETVFINKSENESCPLEILPLKFGKNFPAEKYRKIFH